MASSKIVVGNWKMHGSLVQVRAWAEQLSGLALAESVEWAVCPPAAYLQAMAAGLTDTPVALGAQDVSAHEQGAHTGEIAADMLVDLGCRYVLVGHSERRQAHAEEAGRIAARLERALEAGLIPILCVGESLAQREAGKELETVEGQLQPLLKHATRPPVAMVAYEPVWAIGTGQTASPEQAQQVHAHIRQLLTSAFGAPGRTLPLLYGGSVNEGNARALFAQADIDGALVGGASLNAEQFAAIGRAAETE